MPKLHVYCDFWEQSASRGLHEVRKHGRHSLHIEHIHAGNMVTALQGLVAGVYEHDVVLIVLLHVEKYLLHQAGKLLSSQPATVRKCITVSYSRYSPEIGAWAKQIGVNYEVNEYEAPRHSPWEPSDVAHGTTLEERRWIQYRLMRVLISGEPPGRAYEEIFKKLRHSRLSRPKLERSQRFYELGEPDMAGGNFTEERKANPNAIDLLRERTVHVGLSGLNTLIIGETGTGKESFAWYLHDFSTRCDKPLFALNCAFFEGERLESELFGHELGAFTDAKRMKRGLVEEADGGTLFLDELPEMEPRVQAKLLRFLQDGTYVRLGGNKVMRANVRIISATQPNRMDTLRQDLYYRVADVELHTVPLREMKQRDIVNIACNLAYRLMWRPFSTEKGQSILTPNLIREVWHKLTIPEHAACLSSYGWPGNMRELSTLIKRFVLLGDDIFTEIRESHKPAQAMSDNESKLQRFLMPVSSLEELKARDINLKELQPVFVR
ncbi:MAG TPA: sigma 54-interacting transcriptional regulator, partial [Desulfuromonadaceae bacterium]